jgi:hypothetical protein
MQWKYQINEIRYFANLPMARGIAVGLRGETFFLAFGAEDSARTMGVDEAFLSSRLVIGFEDGNSWYDSGPAAVAFFFSSSLAFFSPLRDFLLTDAFRF